MVSSAEFIMSHARCMSYTNTAQVAQCIATSTKSFQLKTIRNKQVSALDGILDGAQNEVDSETENDI